MSQVPRSNHRCILADSPSSIDAGPDKLAKPFARLLVSSKPKLHLLAATETSLPGIAVCLRFQGMVPASLVAGGKIEVEPGSVGTARKAPVERSYSRGRCIVMMYREEEVECMGLKPYRQSYAIYMPLFALLTPRYA
ncbi:hypothetical protein PSPO01_09697 [Paraphaeosphaeria sporulosa]